MTKNELIKDQTVAVEGQGTWRPVITHIMDTSAGRLIRVADSRGNSGVYRPEQLTAVAK